MRRLIRPRCVRARDDFLPGVATLRETKRVDEIQIEHLRNEQLARLGIDLRLSRGGSRRSAMPHHRAVVRVVVH